MPNLLKKLRISSVDLCRRGANPLARIAMSKSGTGADWRARLEALLDGDVDEAQAMRELKLIVAGMAGGQGEHAPDSGHIGGTPARGQAMGAEGDACGRAVSDDGAEGQAGSGSYAPGADAQAASALETAGEANGGAGSAKADALRLLAHERALATARRYEALGMDTNALAQRLENLRALDEAACDDYEALLDELAEARRVAPLMKEYGSARSAGNVLERRVAEMMRAQPGISRAEAVVRAYQAYPDMPEVL